MEEVCSMGRRLRLRDRVVAGNGSSMIRIILKFKIRLSDF